MTQALSPHELLQWYLEAGVDEAIGAEPLDRYALSQAALSRATAAAPVAAPPSAAAHHQGRPAAPTPQSHSEPHALASEIAGTAAHIAASCKTIEDLRQAVEAFPHPLKVTANRTVFADGSPQGKLMVIGEAPGFDEDRLGLPFVGASGKLLDRMLAAIGLDRSNCYISNVLFWRPPANRTPTPQDVEACLPFVLRHIELVDPPALLLLGGAAAKALLARNEGIGQLRGHWQDFSTPGLNRPVPALATYHPAFLLRTPEMKAQAWRDLLMVAEKLILL